MVANSSVARQAKRCRTSIHSSSRPSAAVSGSASAASFTVVQKEFQAAPVLVRDLGERLRFEDPEVVHQDLDARMRGEQALRHCRRAHVAGETGDARGSNDSNKGAPAWKFGVYR